MKTDTTHGSAVTQFVEADGIRFAFRRIGAATGTPIVFCHRFRGTMDDWDPAVINGFRLHRAIGASLEVPGRSVHPRLVCGVIRSDL
jgi:pimeloyl-ACP methyl ester carboxylesterase